MKNSAKVATKNIYDYWKMSALLKLQKLKFGDFDLKNETRKGRYSRCRGPEKINRIQSDDNHQKIVKHDRYILV